MSGVRPCAGGPAQRPTEYQVKAAFLYNFAKFTEWPDEVLPGEEEPMVIGVLGEDPFGDTLDETVLGKTVKGRHLRVRRVERISDGLRKCHIVFVSSSETTRLHELFEILRGAPVLLVGDTDGFARAGGMINFVLIQNRIRFEINVDAAEKVGLELSSRLLKLAKIVSDENP